MEAEIFFFFSLNIYSISGVTVVLKLETNFHLSSFSWACTQDATECSFCSAACLHYRPALCSLLMGVERNVHTQRFGEYFQHPVAAVRASGTGFPAFCWKLHQHLLQTLFHFPFKCVNSRQKQFVLCLLLRKFLQRFRTLLLPHQRAFLSDVRVCTTILLKECNWILRALMAPFGECNGNNGLVLERLSSSVDLQEHARVNNCLAPPAVPRHPACPVCPSERHTGMFFWMAGCPTAPLLWKLLAAPQPFSSALFTEPLSFGCFAGVAMARRIFFFFLVGI